MREAAGFLRPSLDRDRRSRYRWRRGRQPFVGTPGGAPPPDCNPSGRLSRAGLQPQRRSVPRREGRLRHKGLKRSGFSDPPRTRRSVTETAGGFAETRRFPWYPHSTPHGPEGPHGNQEVPVGAGGIPPSPEGPGGTPKAPEASSRPRSPKRPRPRTGPPLPRRGKGGLRWKAKGTYARQSPSGPTVG